MRILLDTNILIWSLTDPGRLAKTAGPALVNPENEVFFSAVSIWEIAIKFGLQRADFTVEPRAIADQATTNGFIGLPMTIGTAASVATLAMHHRDPFDRLLIAQALAGPMQFYTADTALAVYSDLVHIVR
jgi:PIN domain nuclease of toxin-antitoxin system